MCKGMYRSIKDGRMYPIIGNSRDIIVSCGILEASVLTQEGRYRSLEPAPVFLHDRTRPYHAYIQPLSGTLVRIRMQSR